MAEVSSALLTSQPLVDNDTAGGQSLWRRVALGAELWVPAGLLVLLLFFCFIWPEIFPVPSPTLGSLSDPNLRPFSPGHILGTDPLGNDIMSRLLYGGRVSLEVGFGTAIIGLVVGGGLGLFAGYKGGWIDATVMRVLDVFLAFPSLVLAMTITTYLGPSELHVIYAISFFAIPAFARLARSATTAARAQTFVTAAKLSGARDGSVMFKHIAPNILPQLVTFSLLGVAIAVTVEAALSFLGLGVPPPGASWGNMIELGQQNIYSNPDLVLIPSVLLFLTVMALNLLGDSVRRRWVSR